MARIIAKKVCIFTVMLSICIMQMTTAFAYDRICYMTEEEVFNKVWDMYVDRNYHDETDFLTSLKMAITRGELKNFIHNYTPINEDVNVNDVKNEYDKYLSDVLFKTMVIEEDENGHYCEYDTKNPDKKYYWTYNQTTDNFICRTSDGKEIVKTYDRYYYEKEKPTQLTTVQTHTDSYQSNTQNIVREENKTEPLIATSDEVANNTNSDKNSDYKNYIKLAVLLLVVAGGIVFVAVQHKKNKKRK